MKLKGNVGLRVNGRRVMERKVERVFTGKKNKRVKANDMKRGEKVKRTTILLAALAMVFGLTGSAQAYTFVKLAVPGATRTQAYGINDSGNVVGTYRTGYPVDIVYHGFVYDGSTYTTLDVPGATWTRAYGINDSGIIVGEYQDGSGDWHGFIYGAGTYTTLDVNILGASGTSARGINDSGEVAGYYYDSSYESHGFVYNGSTYTTWDVNIPGASYTSLRGINDSGDIIGSYSDSSFDSHTFIYDGSTYTTLAVPGASFTGVSGINDSGVVVGESSDGSFIYDGSTYTTLDVPGARFRSTRAYGINDSGDIVGYYADFAGVIHGFIAGEVPLSATNHDYSGDDADPVNTYTGEYFFSSKSDLYLGGPMPLRFSRYYASGLKQSGVTGSLGDNWRHNFEWSLTVSGTDATIASDKGRSITFSYNGASWDLTGSTNIPFQFVQSGGDYILYNPGIGLLYTFDSGGKLIKIEDGKGNTHTLTYSGSDLTTVSDGLGRTLTFTYSGGKLSTVSDGTRTVTFAYTGDDLTSYTDAAGSVTTYAYDSGGLMTAKSCPEVIRPTARYTARAEG